MSYTNALTYTAGVNLVPQPVHQQVAQGFEIGDLIRRAFDWVSCGVVILDDELRPLFANKAARQLMQSGRLPLSSPASVHRPDPISGIRRAIASLGAARSTSTCRIGEPALFCTVARLTRPSAGKTPRVIIFVVDSARTRTTRLAEVQGFGLSHAQAVFAVEFAKGHSLRTCADRLGISLTTAKTHLRQIFAKTGASRQADLMRLILTSTPALDYDDDPVACLYRHVDRAG